MSPGGGLFRMLRGGWWHCAAGCRALVSRLWSVCCFLVSSRQIRWCETERRTQLSTEDYGLCVSLVLLLRGPSFLYVMLWSSCRPRLCGPLLDFVRRPRDHLLRGQHAPLSWLSRRHVLFSGLDPSHGKTSCTVRLLTGTPVADCMFRLASPTLCLSATSISRLFADGRAMESILRSTTTEARLDDTASLVTATTTGHKKRRFMYIPGRLSALFMKGP